MSDKSFGDYTNRNVVKNPLLSTAVTGLSIEDLTNNAVLLPAIPNQGLISSQDTSNPKLPPITENEANKHHHGDFKPIPKTKDDFDVNEYFARLQGTRYVSAPMHCQKEEQSANLEAEEGILEEINLNELPAEETQSIASDLAQNFSQLPQVLPQVASAVFSSFTNMLSMKSRDQTPEKKVEVQVKEADLNVEVLSAPPLKEPPKFVGSTNTYRMAAKKKSYAPIPGLSSGEPFQNKATPIEIQTSHSVQSFYDPSHPNQPIESLHNISSLNPSQSSQSIPPFEISSNKFYEPISLSPHENQRIGSQENVANFNSSQSTQSIKPHVAVSSNQGLPSFYDLTAKQTNLNQPAQVDISGEIPPAKGLQSLYEPSAQPSNLNVHAFNTVSSTPTGAQDFPAQNIKSTEDNKVPTEVDLKDSGQQQIDTQSGIIPPPPMFSSMPQRSEAPDAISRSILPPSVARRVSNQPKPPQMVTTNYFVPLMLESNPNNMDNDKTIADNEPIATDIFQAPTSIQHDVKSIDNTDSNKTGVNMFNPATLATNAQEILPVTTHKSTSTSQNEQSSLFNTPNHGPMETVNQPPPPEPKPLPEPPKMLAGQSYRLTKKRPQYYSGPIEGIGSVSNNIKPSIPSYEQPSTSYQGSFFTPNQFATESTPLFSPSNESVLKSEENTTNRNETFLQTNVPNANLNEFVNRASEEQYSTTFDLSRPENEPEVSKQETSPFGLLGSLKSKLTSIDINKIQNTVTTFFDPNYNIVKTNEQGYTPNPTANFEVFVPNVEQNEYGQNNYANYDYNQSAHNYYYEQNLSQPHCNDQQFIQTNTEDTSFTHQQDYNQSNVYNFYNPTNAQFEDNKAPAHNTFPLQEKETMKSNENDMKEKQQYEYTSAFGIYNPSDTQIKDKTVQAYDIFASQAHDTMTFNEGEVNKEKHQDYISFYNPTNMQNINANTNVASNELLSTFDNNTNKQTDHQSDCDAIRFYDPNNIQNVKGITTVSNNQNLYTPTSIEAYETNTVIDNNFNIEPVTNNNVFTPPTCDAQPNETLKHNKEEINKVIKSTDLITRQQENIQIACNLNTFDHTSKCSPDVFFDKPQADDINSSPTTLITEENKNLYKTIMRSQDNMYPITSDVNTVNFFDTKHSLRADIERKDTTEPHEDNKYTHEPKMPKQISVSKLNYCTLPLQEPGIKGKDNREVVSNINKEADKNIYSTEISKISEINYFSSPTLHSEEAFTDRDNEGSLPKERDRKETPTLEKEQPSLSQVSYFSSSQFPIQETVLDSKETTPDKKLEKSETDSFTIHSLQSEQPSATQIHDFEVPSFDSQEKQPLIENIESNKTREEQLKPCTIPVHTSFFDLQNNLFSPVSKQEESARNRPITDTMSSHTSYFDLQNDFKSSVSNLASESVYESKSKEPSVNLFNVPNPLNEDLTKDDINVNETTNYFKIPSLHAKEDIFEDKVSQVLIPEFISQMQANNSTSETIPENVTKQEHLSPTPQSSNKTVPEDVQEIPVNITSPDTNKNLLLEAVKQKENDLLNNDFYYNNTAYPDDISGTTYSLESLPLAVNMQQDTQIDNSRINKDVVARPIGEAKPQIQNKINSVIESEINAIADKVEPNLSTLANMNQIFSKKPAPSIPPGFEMRAIELGIFPPDSSNKSNENKPYYIAQDSPTPTAPMQDDLLDSNTGPIDVNLIEQDAKNYFPIDDEFIEEPVEERVDSFTDRIDKYNKQERSMTLENSMEQIPLYQCFPNTAVTLTSYFDTGNYAAESHYKKSITSPASMTSKSSVFSPESLSNLNLTDLSIKDDREDTSDPNLESNQITEPILEEQKKEESFEVKEELKDPLNFFSEPKNDDQYDTTNRLASYFMTPANTKNTQSFFELSQGQKHLRKTDKSNSNIDNSDQERIQANIQLKKDITSKIDFKPPKDGVVKIVNYFEVEYFNKLLNNVSHKETQCNKLDFLSPQDVQSISNISEDNEIGGEVNKKCICKTNNCNEDLNLNKKIENDVNKKCCCSCKKNKTKSDEDLNKESNVNKIKNDLNKNSKLTDKDTNEKNETEFIKNKIMENNLYKNSDTDTKIIQNVDNFKIRKNMDTEKDVKDGTAFKSGTCGPGRGMYREPVKVNFQDGFKEVEDGWPDSHDNRASSEYEPVRYHWFYRIDRDGKSVWKGFSVVDSTALEEAFNKSDLSEGTLVATDGGRYDVNLIGRLRIAVYWPEKPTNVRRCSWFYKGNTDIRYVPYTEATATILEDEYRNGIITGVWHRRLCLPNNDVVVMHGPNVMEHFLNSTHDAWASGTIFGKKVYRNPPKIKLAEDQNQKIDHLVFMIHGAGEWRQHQRKLQSATRQIRRGHEESEIEENEPSNIDHLLLLCHGVGSACDLKMRPIEDVVEDFRSTSLHLIQGHYKNSYDNGVIGRVEMLPISWHSTLHSGPNGVDRRLAQITLDSIPKLRNFTNDTVLDVLFYTSPIFCQIIIDTVSAELNRIYDLFKQRNPDFKGGVSLGGHSLGSVILYDLLCHQETAEVSPQKKMLSNQNGTYVKYPKIKFDVEALYALGSPIAIFECIRGVELLGEEFRLPTCKAFYNIFHPYDPIAYRIEPLINPDLKSIPPYLIPHHKGRKRMHLELKETMARVGADIKQKLVDYMKSTWSMWKPPTPTPEQLEKVVEEQIENVELLDCKDEASQMIDDSKAKLLGNLNGGRRVDYVLQEAPLEIINEYIFAMTSHVCYWDSEDTMLMMLREIYLSMDIQPDCTVPQQTMTVERTRVEQTIVDDIKVSSVSGIASTSRDQY